jgi:hypothetical protein
MSVEAAPIAALRHTWSFFPQKNLLRFDHLFAVRDMSVPSPGMPPKNLLRAVTSLLRPLVRLLMRSGVTFPVLSDLLRTLYVDVAARDLLRDPRAATDSRISLISGVHRKEIRRLRLLGQATEPEPEAVTLASQIIARWLGTPLWTDAQGQPVPLPRTADPGEPSFEGLVESVTRDVRPRAVLDEWLSQELVTQDAAGRLELNVRAFVPPPGREEQLFYFGRNLHDHIAAAGANVAAVGSAPFLDRSVHYDRLPAEAVARLEAIGREMAQQMLLEFNRVALAEADAAGEIPQPGRRINFGVYIYTDDD